MLKIDIPTNKLYLMTQKRW